MKNILFLILTLFALTASKPAEKISRVDAYIENHLFLAQYVEKMYNVPVSVQLAQAIFESGAGISEVAQKANNHFGIKYSRNDYFGIKCGTRFYSWRKYDNVAASYIDHAKFFIDRKGCEWPYGKRWQTWCKVLGLCGYAGVEESERYEMSLTRIIHTYQLYKYDKKQ